MKTTRRTLPAGLGAGATSFAATLALPGLVRAQNASAHVVVVCGGFGGATAAGYLSRYNPALKITLIEPAATFATCPFSNLYLGGLRTRDSITRSCDALRAAGIAVIQASTGQIDGVARKVTLSEGTVPDYDRLCHRASTSDGARWRAMTRPPQRLPPCLESRAADAASESAAGSDDGWRHLRDVDHR
ncbi:NAD(P)/FAD-dependent oxidoreductase [Pseudogemmobacter bohemicus]|uniref:NAD(P)/FAD-dependent oxidoreductase n=1 Tax=Pseudogemmobacter bohemicus TaxID=2250708 RepID=UPI0018E4E380|nr:FAD/NAD(P)-binding oxidoreductase [Pseudogemmobacter bohemicus]